MKMHFGGCGREWGRERSSAWLDWKPMASERGEERAHFERVVWREADVNPKDATLIRRLRGPCEHGLPVVEVLARGPGAAVLRRILLDVLQLLHIASTSMCPPSHQRRQLGRPAAGLFPEHPLFVLSGSASMPLSPPRSSGHSVPKTALFSSSSSPTPLLPVSLVLCNRSSAEAMCTLSRPFIASMASLRHRASCQVL